MMNIEPNYDEMMKLYDRLETVKQGMGERYLLHPSNFVQNRNKANDDTPMLYSTTVGQMKFIRKMLKKAARL